MSASKFVTEVQILTALLKLNARGLECLPHNWFQIGESLRNSQPPNAYLSPFPAVDICHPEYAEIAARFDFPIWMRTIELAGKNKTITSQNLCRAIADTLLNPWQGAVANLPPLIDFLGICYGERSKYKTSMFDEAPRVLEDMPQTRHAIESLGQVPSDPDDFQYALCI